MVKKKKIESSQHYMFKNNQENKRHKRTLKTQIKHYNNQLETRKTQNN
jgi:hypothetical protein